MMQNDFVQFVKDELGFVVTECTSTFHDESQMWLTSITVRPKDGFGTASIDVFGVTISGNINSAWETMYNQHATMIAHT